MRKIFLIAMLSATTALLSTQAFADPVKRILPQGKDGDYYYYQVRCTNGSEGSVVVEDKEKTVCAQALGRDRICNASWTVQKAAEQACK
jgi:hypothetical protein